MLRGWASPRPKRSTEDSKDDDDDDAPRARARWTSRTEFLLATVGNCVGVGNVWRFPYLCYRNGGGGFLIPYFMALLFIGVPVFLLELALGQRFQRGATLAYEKLHRRLRGFGVAGTVMAFATLSYYNVILAWTIVYMVHSLRTPLPFRRVDAEPLRVRESR